MSKLSTSLALAALLAAGMPAAHAANTPRGSLAASENSIQPDQIRASKMIGSTVYDVQNRDIGKVEDLVLSKSGRLDAVVLDVGSFLGMGGKYVAVRPGSIKTNHRRLTLDVTKAQLKRMPSFKLANRNTGAGTSTSPVHGGKLGSGR